MADLLALAEYQRNLEVGSNILSSSAVAMDRYPKDDDHITNIKGQVRALQKDRDEILKKNNIKNPRASDKMIAISQIIQVPIAIYANTPSTIIRTPIFSGLEKYINHKDRNKYYVYLITPTTITLTSSPTAPPSINIAYQPKNTIDHFIPLIPIDDSNLPTPSTRGAAHVAEIITSDSGASAFTIDNNNIICNDDDGIPADDNNNSDSSITMTSRLPPSLNNSSSSTSSGGNSNELKTKKHDNEEKTWPPILSPLLPASGTLVGATNLVTSNNNSSGTASASSFPKTTTTNDPSMIPAPLAVVQSTPAPSPTPSPDPSKTSDNEKTSLSLTSYNGTGAARSRRGGKEPKTQDNQLKGNSSTSGDDNKAKEKKDGNGTDRDDTNDDSETDTDEEEIDWPAGVKRPPGFEKNISWFIPSEKDIADLNSSVAKVYVYPFMLVFKI